MTNQNKKMLLYACNLILMLSVIFISPSMTASPKKNPIDVLDKKFETIEKSLNNRGALLDSLKKTTFKYDRKR